MNLFRFVTVALAAALLSACSPEVDVAVPTHEVASGPFQHRVTAEGRLEAVSTTKLSVPSEVQRSVRLAWLVQEGTILSEGDLVARFDEKAMQERLSDGERDLSSSSMEIERTEIESGIELNNLEKDLNIAQIELEHARNFQKTDDQVFSRRDIQEDAIDEVLATDRKRHAELSAETRRSLAQTEIDLLEIQRRQARHDIDTAQAGLQALEIIAPHAGVLTLKRNWRGDPPRIGMEMWRGQELGEIPDLSKMRAQVYVLEADAGGLAEGKPAEVVIEAFPDRVFKAEIESVEAVAQPRFRGSPVQYFGVLLAFESTDAAVMKPGSRVRATLFLEQRDDAVVVPRQAVFQNGSGSKVFVQKGKGFEVRPVEVGPASLGSIVIEAGLQPGERVALAQPADPDDSSSSDPAGEPQATESDPNIAASAAGAAP